MKAYDKNTAYINAIFKRDQNGHYTNDALFYQDILRYYFVINPAITANNRFRLLDLKKWIVENNLEIKEYFQDSRNHTSPSNKVHIKEGQINRKFEDLVEMHLIRRVGQETYKTTKNINVMADICEYTNQGILILLIIESNNNMEYTNLSLDKGNKKHDELENIYSAIYYALNSLLMDRIEPPYMNIFYYSLFKKSKDHSLFQKLVQQMYNILNTDNIVRSISNLLAYTVSSTYLESSTQREFFKLWKQTIEELEPNVRQIVLYQMKLLAEQRFQNIKAPLSRTYEKVRFKYRANPNYIVVDGDCKVCGYYKVIPLNYIEYVKSITDPNNILKKMKCKKCNTKDGIIISKF
ncbi:MAG TPA: hypothetical protein VKA95_00355 [Nitrososphaeraceae archaeon]|nr:hypothetical protein [Nitrososphaeraceae archaeon]